MNILELDLIAENIYGLINGVDTDYRGDLLALVAVKLMDSDQNYTGSLFANAAREYGVNLLKDWVHDERPVQ